MHCAQVRRLHGGNPCCDIVRLHITPAPCSALGVEEATTFDRGKILRSGFFPCLLHLAVFPMKSSMIALFAISSFGHLGQALFVASLKLLASVHLHRTAPL